MQLHLMRLKSSPVHSTYKNCTKGAADMQYPLNIAHIYDL